VGGYPTELVDPLGLFGQTSGGRAPPSHSWKQPPGLGGSYGSGVGRGPGADPALEQTPGAWSGTQYAYGLVCVRGSCPADPMECHANLPSRRDLFFVGGYPSTSRFYQENPGCTCTGMMWSDQVSSGTPDDPRASLEDAIEIMTKIREVW
jgi:hypothetical protein